MSIEDVGKSLVEEVTDPDVKKPAAGVDHGRIADEAEKHPDPRNPDQEEVQYPGYFKEGGSL